jgi:hypothetical protein
MYAITFILACLAIVNPSVLATPIESAQEHASASSSISAQDEILLRGYVNALEASNLTSPQGFGDLLKGLLGNGSGEGSGSSKGKSGGLDV